MITQYMTWFVMAVLWMWCIFAAGYLAVVFGPMVVIVAFVIGSAFLYGVGYLGVRVDDSFEKQNRRK